MVRLVFCVRRLPSLSAEEFLTYWRDVHGPLVQRNSDALRIQRYEQSHPIRHAVGGTLASVRGAPEGFDGIASLWFERADDITDAVLTPEGRRAARELQDDERRFIDLARSPIWLVDDVAFDVGKPKTQPRRRA